MNNSPGSGALANSSEDSNVDDGTFHGLPYSSEIRQLYLETALKSQVRPSTRFLQELWNSMFCTNLLPLHRRT